LAKYNKNKTIEIYRLLVSEGKISIDFDSTIKNFLFSKPELLKFKYFQMSFILTSDNKEKECIVKTGDYKKTFAYYLAINHGRKIFFNIGGRSIEKTSAIDNNVFPRNIAYGEGGIVFGTPYNFIPSFLFENTN